MTMKLMIAATSALVACAPAYAAPVGLVENADVPYVAKWETPAEPKAAPLRCWPVMSKLRPGEVLYWTGEGDAYCAPVKEDGPSSTPRTSTPQEPEDPYCEDDKPERPSKPEKPKKDKPKRPNKGGGNGGEGADPGNNPDKGNDDE